jgi:hypothetical protein
LNVQALYKSLLSIHKSLFLVGDFPALPKTSYFNRKEQEILGKSDAVDPTPIIRAATVVGPKNY